MDKKTLKLGIILIILIALAYLYQGSFQEWKSNSAKPNNFLSGIDVSQIDRIEIIKNNKITKNNKIIIIEKQGDKWKIADTKNFYVAESLAVSLNKALEEAISADVELVSSNKDKKSEFKTDESGVRVKLYAQPTSDSSQEGKPTPDPSQEGNLMADFIVGKTANDFVSAYILEFNSDKTYKIKANLSGLFNREDWYDKNIFSSSKENISKIRFQYPDREFNLEKINGEWAGVSPYEFGVDEEKINKILDIMADLTAVEIPEQIFENTGLEKNLIIIQATGEGIDNTLMIGDDNGEELYYVKKGDSDNIYLIIKAQRDELDKQIKDMK